MKFQNQFLLSGIAAGFCAGILFAPASGSQSRKLIRKSAIAGKEAVYETASDARREVETIVTRGNLALRRGKTSMRKAFHRAGRALLNA